MGGCLTILDFKPPSLEYVGVFLPTAISQVLARFPKRAGTASAMQGFIQMSGGGVGVFVVSALQPSLPILSMPAVKLGSVLFAALVFRLGIPPALAATRS